MPAPKGRGLVERWKPVHAGGRWDYRDCEAYQIAAAYMANVHLLPPPEAVMQTKRAQARQLQDQQKTQDQRRQRRSEAWTPTPVE